MSSGVGRLRLSDQGPYPGWPNTASCWVTCCYGCPASAQSKSYVVMEEIKETLVLSTEVPQV